MIQHGVDGQVSCGIEINNFRKILLIGVTKLQRDAPASPFVLDLCA